MRDCVCVCVCMCRYVCKVPLPAKSDLKRTTQFFKGVQHFTWVSGQDLHERLPEFLTDFSTTKSHFSYILQLQKGSKIESFRYIIHLNFNIYFLDKSTRLNFVESFNKGKLGNVNCTKVVSDFGGTHPCLRSRTFRIKIIAASATFVVQSIRRHEST